MPENLREVMANSRLKTSARLAYLWLRWTAHDGYSYETNAQLGERLGLGEEAVRVIACELEAADPPLVRREGYGRKRRWAMLGLSAALFTVSPNAQPADASTLDLVNSPSNLHSAVKKRRRSKAPRAEQTAA